jgi:hypothetical protein
MFTPIKVAPAHGREEWNFATEQWDPQSKTTEEEQEELNRAARRIIPEAAGNSVPALRDEFNRLLDTLRDQGIIDG